MFIFGGIAPRTRDIRRVSDSKLVDMGKLPFDLYLGTCTAFNGNEILLCFDHFDAHQCYKTDVELSEYTKLSKSFADHTRSRISYSPTLQRTLTVSGYHGPNVAELFDHADGEEGTWTRVADYPYGDRCVV